MLGRRRTLLVRYINAWTIFFVVETAHPLVRDQTDDLPDHRWSQLEVARHQKLPHRNSLAKRIFIWKISRRHGFVDDRHERRILAIAIAEGSALPQSEADRVKIRRAHDLEAAHPADAPTVRLCFGTLRGLGV